MNKVLVVEDEDDLRRIIASYLRQEIDQYPLPKHGPG